MIGKTISHYKILEKLGEGGMGVVFKAHDTNLDRIIALKFLPQHLTSDEKEKERFIHEAKAASKISHTNITTIYEIDEYEGQTFIAMEFVEGRTLREILKTETLSIKKVLDIAIQTCDGLTNAHERGIVHRDIKSENIMVTPRGIVKILDFGLAKLKEVSKLTKTGSTLGTTFYMSPEQAQGEEVDHRSDIFSFGVVLYEMLTKQLPFKGEHQAAIVYSIICEEPQPVVRFNNKVSSKLEEIIFKTLEKEKEERYQHIDDLLADLRRERKSLEYSKISEVSHIKQVPASVTEEEERKIKQLPKVEKTFRRYLFSAAAIIVLILLIVIFNPFNFEISPKKTVASEKNSIAVMYFENFTDPEDKNCTGDMLTNLLITSLSQIPNLEVISSERLYSIQRDLGYEDEKSISPSLATKIAERAGVQTMILGSILQEEPKIVATSRLIDVETGKIIKSQRLDKFSIDQLFPLVDSLTYLIRNDLEIYISPQIETKSVAEVTTNSIEAYRSFIEGVELQKKYYNEEAKAAFEKSVELDSNFALAHLFLDNLILDPIVSKMHRNKALELSKNVTDQEKLRIQAQVYRNEGNLQKAAEILETLIKKHPYEQAAYERLALLYQSCAEFEKSLNIINKGLKNDSLDKNLWNTLGYHHAGMNRKREALESINQYIKLAPAEPNPYDSKAEIYFAFGELDTAMVWYQKALSQLYDFWSLEQVGVLFLLLGEYNKAEKYFQSYYSFLDKQLKWLAEADFISLQMYQGKLGHSKKQIMDYLETKRKENLQEAIKRGYRLLINNAYEEKDYSEMLKTAQLLVNECKKDPDDIIYGRDYLVWALIKNDNARKSYNLIEKIKEDLKTTGKHSERWYYYTQALLKNEEKKYEESIELYEKSFQYCYPNRSPQYFYALSLLHLGKIEQAVTEFKHLNEWPHIGHVTRAHLQYFDLSWSPTYYYGPIAAAKSHYWLGVAYEKLGEKEKAVKEFETFLYIWKESDFKSNEITDAKTRIAKLKGIVKK